MVEIVDLSQEIYHKHPLHHAHPPTVMWTHVEYDEARRLLGNALDVDEPPFVYTSKMVQMNDHASTHVDAFSHLGPGGATIDEMSFDYFYGPGKAISITHYDGTSDAVFTVEDMERACDEAGVEIEEGDILLIDTGHYEANYPDPAYVEDYVGLSAEATEWMVEKGVVNFGVDAPGPDNSNDKTYPVHQVCRDAGLPHIENLKNIDQVVGEEFTFSGLPLKLREGSGGPMRAVAILEE
jgi:kynurenine formamidase